MITNIHLANGIWFTKLSDGRIKIFLEDHLPKFEPAIVDEKSFLEVVEFLFPGRLMYKLNKKTIDDVIEYGTL